MLAMINFVPFHPNWVYYKTGSIWNTRYISLYDALVSAAVIGVGEWFFHEYVDEQLIPSPKED
ncbi:YndM family protein [Clostridium sp. CS001]|uniref:DUF2512 family protein n=1 Tax=Clostridium sp. CS001 TaxID=2880648 RepID=UPI001CF1E682|nr:DUF2512 family protein [Clostridium sp. CS001]MCB2289838.1 YndM family protein [Clostridium sp. CS001]